MQLSEKTTDSPFTYNSVHWTTATTLNDEHVYETSGVDVKLPA